MKKVLVFIAFIALFSFKANEEKTLKVELTLAKWQTHLNNIQGVKAYVEKSNLPHQDVMFISGIMDSLTKDLVIQLRAQIDTGNKKVKP